MSSHNYSYDRCHTIVITLYYHLKELDKVIGSDDISQLLFSCEKVKDAENSDRFGEPMMWIGIYIAVATFVCILAMAADLLHGFRNKKFWFPCKYFSLNAASITVITVAMKLPVDLSSGMLSYEDQAAKVGSLAFMCIMMANIMPSLATMDNTTLLANILGLSILVITVIVNICIQINTSVISNGSLDSWYYYSYSIDFIMSAYIYTTMILLLLIVLISSSLAIPFSKEILESKYQATNKISLTDRSPHIQVSVVEKLRRHVRRCWVMTETGSPQFWMASNPLTTVTGVICVMALVINLLTVFNILFRFYRVKLLLFDFKTLGESPYRWSTAIIFIVQSIGVMVGSIAPISRCFPVFGIKLGTKGNKNYFILLKVEKYWTQKLHDWKESPIRFLSRGRRSRRLIYNSKNIFLSLCIRLQEVIVVLCKVIWLVVIVASIFVTSCLYHWKSLKSRWFATPITSRTDDIDEEDLCNYVLQIDNKIVLAGRTPKVISKSMNYCILKAEKEQNNNLFDLLKKSTGFEGVQIFDMDHVQPLLPINLVNNWSLPIVTLTCIVVALSDIHKDEVESLLRSVGEGLSFTHLVEESLNSANEYVNIRKSAMILWHEVENKWKWLDNPLAKKVYKEKTSTEIVKTFSDKAKEIMIEVKDNTDAERVENLPHVLIAANSMYRITQTILSRFHSNVELITKKQLRMHLTGIIADIFSACFTNIPRVIIMRCHESVIEKREVSVKVAAKLLGTSIKIIERLETCDIVVPNLDENKLAYIDEWRLYMKQSII